MIKISHQDGTPYQEGVECLKAILLGRARTQLFDPVAVEELVRESGGVVADMLRNARASALSAIVEQRDTVSVADVQAEHRANVRLYFSLIDEALKGTLTRIAIQRRADNDGDLGRLLHMLAVLEYENDRKWYDVHPSVRAMLRDEGRIQ
jgi:hypothetical protein